MGLGLIPNCSAEHLLSPILYDIKYQNKSHGSPSKMNCRAYWQPREHLFRLLHVAEDLLCAHHRM